VELRHCRRGKCWRCSACDPIGDTGAELEAKLHAEADAVAVGRIRLWIREGACVSFQVAARAIRLGIRKTLHIISAVGGAKRCSACDPVGDTESAGTRTSELELLCA
jgi:hypothetical protein